MLWEWRKRLSGRGDSNPRQKLGRLLCYRYTTPAIYRQTRKKMNFVKKNPKKRGREALNGFIQSKILLFTFFE